ncbi:hypothetical protein [Halarchaeum sp. P4]|uniref:hypothetical protein n=1 Tax=Halarchaeum sp. P4 TaxID=3421639 RepID=UPI003EB70ADB
MSGDRVERTHLLTFAEYATLDLVGFAVLAIGFVAESGGPGGVVALAVGVCWLLADVRVATVPAVVGLGVLDLPGLAGPILVVGGLVISIGGTLALTTRSWRALGVFAVATSVLAIAAYAGTLAALPLWVLTGLVLALFGVLTYGLHRYELVVLDLLPTDE